MKFGNVRQAVRREMAMATATMLRPICQPSKDGATLCPQGSWLLFLKAAATPRTICPLESQNAAASDSAYALQVSFFLLFMSQRWIVSGTQAGPLGGFVESQL